MPDLADLMTPKEAAASIGLNVNSIYRLIERGKLEGIKIGKKQWLVSRKSVSSYQKETAGMSKNDPRRRN